MGTLGYRDDYRTAFTCANDHLDQIYEQYHQLQLRKQHLEGVLSALEPMLYSDGSATEASGYSEPEQFAPTAQEPSHEESYPEPVQQPVMRIEQSFQPAVPAAFAAATEVITDPLQLRINRALGLAVA